MNDRPVPHRRPQVYAQQPHSALALGAITFRSRSFENIVAAASGAGFDGIGLTVGQCLAALERGIALERLPGIIEDAGLHVAELELVRLCESGPGSLANDLVVELAGLLSPDRVHVAAWTGDRHEVVDAFAAVCTSLEGTPVAYEFMAYNAIPSLALAHQVVQETRAPNAALVLDVLHFFRTGASFDELTVDLMDRVAVVQLSDVVDRPRSDQLDEARHRRTFPGRGALDTTGFLRAVTAEGVLPPISVEPINDAYELMPLAVVADEAMVATSRALARATT